VLVQQGRQLLGRHCKFLQVWLREGPEQSVRDHQHCITNTAARWPQWMSEVLSSACLAAWLIHGISCCYRFELRCIHHGYRALAACTKSACWPRGCEEAVGPWWLASFACGNCLSHIITCCQEAFTCAYRNVWTWDRIDLRWKSRKCIEWQNLARYQKSFGLHRDTRENYMP